MLFLGVAGDGTEWADFGADRTTVTDIGDDDGRTRQKTVGDRVSWTLDRADTTFDTPVRFNGGEFVVKGSGIDRTHFLAYSTARATDTADFFYPGTGVRRTASNDDLVLHRF
jgi:hypothetical protein